MAGRSLRGGGARVGAEEEEGLNGVLGRRIGLAAIPQIAGVLVLPRVTGTDLRDHAGVGHAIKKTLTIWPTIVRFGRTF